MTQAAPAVSPAQAEGAASVERLLVAADALRRTAEALLQRLGLPIADAQICADVFLQSELRGEESHGFRLLLNVLGRIEAGGDQAKSDIKVVRDRGAIAVWDAQRGVGQVVAARAMDRAIEKARHHGVGIVGVRNANSYTSAKYYVLRAADAGMIGITYCNSGRQLVVADGGRTPLTGTNPLAIAAPAATKPHFVLDMAVSVAMEKIYQAHELGLPVPVGWGIDERGNDTTNPADILASRALLPIAGAKGAGLGLAHEILSGVLMGGQLFGGGALGFMPFDGPMNVSQYFQAIDIECFRPLDEFKAQVDEALAQVQGSTARPGVERVYYAGEHSWCEEQRRLREGVPLPRRVVDGLHGWCARLGVPSIEPIA
jgi:LDH2 family malate/lactate/ureidoglycolate dehydrogenase